MSGFIFFIKIIFFIIVISYFLSIFFVSWAVLSSNDAESDPESNISYNKMIILCGKKRNLTFYFSFLLVHFHLLTFFTAWKI